MIFIFVNKVFSSQFMNYRDHINVENFPSNFAIRSHRIFLKCQNEGKNYNFLNEFVCRENVDKLRIFAVIFFPLYYSFASRKKTGITNIFCKNKSFLVTRIFEIYINTKKTSINTNLCFPNLRKNIRK